MQSSVWLNLLLALLTGSSSRKAELKYAYIANYNNYRFSLTITVWSNITSVEKGKMTLIHTIFHHNDIHGLWYYVMAYQLFNTNPFINKYFIVFQLLHHVTITKWSIIPFSFQKLLSNHLIDILKHQYVRIIYWFWCYYDLFRAIACGCTWSEDAVNQQNLLAWN